MIKKLLIFPIVLLLFALPLFSKTEMEMQSFSLTGASLSLKLGFNTDWMYGSRGDALRMGGAQSTLDLQPSFTSYNPAVLSFLPYGTASMGLVPVSIISSDILYPIAKAFAGSSLPDKDFQTFFTNTINDNLSGLIEAFGITVPPSVTVKMNKADVSFGQNTGLMGFEIMMPFAKGQAAVAFARENKTSLDLSMILTDLNVDMKVTDPAQPSLSMDVKAALSAVMNFSMDNIVTSFGVGRKLTPEWGIGCVAEHYDSRFLMDANVGIDASATTYLSGVTSTAAFNTDADNSLEQKASADITGEAWGLRFGTSYHFLNDSIELGADVSMQPQITYKVSPEIVYHILPDTIDPADPTKTEEGTIANVDGTLKIKIPSFVRLTAAFKGWAAAVINYTHYFDSYSFKYDNGSTSAEFDLKMMDALNLGFSFGIFQIGGGAIYTQAYQKTNGVQKNLGWFVIPMASTGVVIPIGDFIRWELDIFVFPLSVLKTAVSYSFK